ncbi:tetratricopeptide repeat protein [Cohnella endophytica]|uniref:Tetratricopeptide repeat protein n=1 Tax=Cohnella endophytica TaxID=2419778 RepID=A0A494Y0P5_9BACL|nr:tetratricopeptide repeat protein [Cohnella endophytica]RKP53922.1 tetratricopeptide repeat protein [Cohnella endophytica]
MAQSNNRSYRFSESPLWELQRSYYEEQGIKAWQSEEVPQYITSNPTIAAAYAEIIFGFLQDRAQAGQISEPVTIVELGSGSGRLAFQVLKELCELKEYAGIPLPSFRYVMSDLAVNNIAYWERHPGLLPYTEQGILDFAHFDAVKDTELRLLRSGVRIQAGDLRQPLLVIANYFFDSIPQELIYVEERKVYECKVTLRYPEQSSKLSASEILGQTTVEYDYVRSDEFERVSYPYRDIIELYKEKLEDSHILLPAIGIGCLERLAALSQQGFLLLTADKGDHRLEKWEFSEPPKIIHHGSFSLTANYHAIQAFFELKGAQTLFPSHHHNDLNIGCVLLLQHPMSYANTRLAYRRSVDRFGPDDFFSMKLWFDGQLDRMELRQILAVWRLGRYDAEWFLQSRKRISVVLPTSTEDDMDDLRSGIRIMWNSFYSMGGKLDLALECGMVLYQMDLFEDALEFFERSVGRTESCASADVLYNLAVCSYEVGNSDAGLDYAKRVLVLQPDHEGANALRVLLEV